MSSAAEMDAQEIINYIATAPKKTPVKLYVREKPGMKVQWGNAHVYGGRRGKTVFGDWDELKAILDANADSIDYYDVENDCRNSAVPMLDLKGINARIEPGAIIRDRVEIGDRAVIMMGAIINIGAIIGELLDLDRRMRTLGDWVQEKTARLIHTREGAPSVADGFVTASLLFCVGAMAVVGSLENGLTGNYDTLKAKSVIDGIAAIVFASSLGVGVAFSAAAIFLYQGAISLAAGLLSPLLSDTVIAEMTCVGSLLIVALGLNMLNVTKIKVMNLVPAIFLPILLCRFM